MLYGDDDTVWLMDSVLEYVADLDPTIPYFITGGHCSDPSQNTLHELESVPYFLGPRCRIHLAKVTSPCKLQNADSTASNMPRNLNVDFPTDRFCSWFQTVSLTSLQRQFKDDRMENQI